MTTIYPPAALPANLADWTTDTYRWMLLQAPFAPAWNTQEFVADISADEVTGAGYSRFTATNNAVDVSELFPAYVTDDPSFGSVATGETATHVVLYREVTNDADSPLLLAAGVNIVFDGTAVTVTIADPAFPTPFGWPSGAVLVTGDAFTYTTIRPYE